MIWFFFGGIITFTESQRRTEDRLIAKNGTGKTTLLNIIGGKEDYDSGEVVSGRPAGRVFGAITFLSGRTDRATGLLPLEERDCPVDR